MENLLWILVAFVFAFGCCIGSFLNVVIYRMPRGKSLVTPPSSCPKCGYRIRWFDNIPIFSWLALLGRCRKCRTGISPRYIIVELITGLAYVGLFVVYFVKPMRSLGIDAASEAEVFLNGGWYLFLLHVILVSAFLAASAIDLELYIIPLSLCWFVTLAGFVGCSLAEFVISPEAIYQNRLFPDCSAKTGIMAVGASIGLIFSLIGLLSGWIKRSYPYDGDLLVDDSVEQESESPEIEYNDRVEMLKEIVFVLPVIIGAAIGWLVFKHSDGFKEFWFGFLNNTPSVSGFLGSLWGYLVGCAVVWATRIFGTLGFGKEAMGMGDVHLMGAAGAVVGPLLVTAAFFVAPFLGIVWAIYQALFKKTRQIPYGPFLSIAVFMVMIFHDEVYSRISLMLLK